MTFETMTQEEYQAADSLPRSLVCELHPDYGRKRTLQARGHHNFWTIFLRLEELFGPGYCDGVGLSEPMKYVERYYLRHVESGRTVCLGTYYKWWRIWADTRDGRGILELIDLVAPEGKDQSLADLRRFAPSIAAEYQTEEAHHGQK